MNARRAALLAAALICTPGLAQPDALLEELARNEQRAADTALPRDDREKAADLAIEIRRAAIDSARPADPRLAPLLVDQAGALLARLSRDGSDSAALFALPTPEQRRRVQSAATDSLALLRRAPVSDDVYRPRILLLVGRSEALLAALDASEPSLHAGRAIEALQPLKLDDPAADAFRRVTLAAALITRAQADDRAQAAELAKAVTTSQAPVASVVEAHLALARSARDGAETLRAALDKPPFRADPLRTVLALGAISRAHLDAWRGTNSPADLHAAFAPHRDLLLGRIDAGLPEDSRQAVALASLSSLVDSAQAGSAELPPEGLLALGLTHPPDKHGRDDAPRLLQAAADHPDAGDLRPIALWEVSVLLSRGGDPAETARVLTAYAREFSGTERAAQAIDAALSAARTAARSSRAGAPLLLDALRVALERNPPHPKANDLRLERARLLAEDPAQLFAFLDNLGRIPADAPQAKEALKLFEHAAAERLDSARAAITTARAALDEAEVRRIAESALPDARRLATYAGAHSSTLADRLRADLADLLIESGYPAQAGPIVRDLLIRRAEVPGARLHLALSRSLQPSDPSAAFTVLRELVGPFDADPAAARPDEYWHAWTLMLETAAAGPDPAKAADIRAQLARLTALDPNLGGEPWKTRLQRVAEPKR